MKKFNVDKFLKDACNMAEQFVDTFEQAMKEEMEKDQPKQEVKDEGKTPPETQEEGYYERKYNLFEVYSLLAKFPEKTLVKSFIDDSEYYFIIDKNKKDLLLIGDDFDNDKITKIYLEHTQFEDSESLAFSCFYDVELINATFTLVKEESWIKCRFVEATKLFEVGCTLKCEDTEHGFGNKLNINWDRCEDTLLNSISEEELKYNWYWLQEL